MSDFFAHEYMSLNICNAKKASMFCVSTSLESGKATGFPFFCITVGFKVIIKTNEIFLKKDWIIGNTDKLT